MFSSEVYQSPSAGGMKEHLYSMRVLCLQPQLQGKTSKKYEFDYQLYLYKRLVNISLIKPLNDILTIQALSPCKQNYNLCFLYREWGQLSHRNYHLISVKLYKCFLDLMQVNQIIKAQLNCKARLNCIKYILGELLHFYWGLSHVLLNMMQFSTVYTFQYLMAGSVIYTIMPF